MHDGKMRKDILYADFVLRESARQASVGNISVCTSKVRRQMSSSLRVRASDPCPMLRSQVLNIFRLFSCHMMDITAVSPSFPSVNDFR